MVAIECLEIEDSFEKIEVSVLFFVALETHIDNIKLRKSEGDSFIPFLIRYPLNFHSLFLNFYCYFSSKKVF